MNRAGRASAAAAVAWAGFGLVVLFLVLDLIILIASDQDLLSAEVVTQGFPIVTLATVISAGIGTAILTRDASNRIGWLLVVGGLGTMTGLLVSDWGRSVITGQLSGSADVGHWALWFGNVVGAPYAIAVVGAIFLLVPDGRLPSRRWRYVGRGLALALALCIAGFFFVPPSNVQPGGVDDAALAADILTSVGFLLLIVCVALSAVALMKRLRRARGIERQQLRWIAASAVAIALALLFLLVLSIVLAPSSETPIYAAVPLYLAYLSVPVATGFAVLRYRLYDVDVIIGRAVVLAVLAVFVTAGYVTVVLLVAAPVGSAGDGYFWTSLLATAVVAFAFQPLRRRVQNLADRVVYGKRAAPYEALAELNLQLGLSLDVQELLPRVAEASARSVGAKHSQVDLLVPGGVAVRALWPPSEPAEAYGDVHEVRHGGELLGAIAVDMGRSSAGRERRLLGDLAAQSALAFRNAQLVAVLRERSAQLERDAVEIEASRRRLVVAAQAERARIARSINREVLAQLAGMPQELDRLETRLSAEPVEAAALATIDELQSGTTEALESLRTITRGVFPAALARRGLVAAVRAQVERSAAPGGFEVDPELAALRWDDRVEGAMYLCCVESLTDLDPPVEVALRRVQGSLVLRIEGNERDSGWQELDHVLMSDRLQSLGGRVTTRRSGARVVVELMVPVELPAARSQPVAADQAAASRSGPKADLGT